ncbi:Bacteriophage holin of superfamily 6 (Holin_LLH) [Caminicella sporogenes DSM 14501]|uniref:Bacteriophage holin of superfamily 6 (Holin_LLH) n=1 Tax=Caminicella sporogenes DSM 14501 TaxID=1121266 RepID=A0A1M6MWW4_9FIRM|nr:hypothetical protein [Caminicella sporogenes]RKD22465.1 hypothetical protein BET04_05380 [Caminicella sporogenes]SHJ87914.1 Bacteriophage holin of superfamily 6 (Holin_LLH) [Caminicella sporogenes DSM 14501]
MLDFIKLYWDSILLVLLVVAGLLYLYKQGKKEFVRKVVLSLVIQAEKALGSGTGELKYAMVVEKVYSVLPTILRFLITKKELDKLIEEAVQYMKKYLSTERNLLGYENEYLTTLRN